MSLTRRGVSRGAIAGVVKRMAKTLTVRFRVDLASQCSVGIGKIELLEGIRRSGSLSQAAREMNMSYRRAWLLLQDMKLSFDQPVARATTGGTGGGGATLTAFGERLVAQYRHLESELQSLAAARFNSFRKHAASASKQASSAGAASAIPVASIRRKPSAVTSARSR
jgi:molybdate transport system regulatory protein